MPELPEVEATVAFLQKHAEGSLVRHVKVGWARSIAKPSVSEFEEVISGALIERLWRRGKYVVFSLSKSGESYYLFGHMRMSGSFDVVLQSALASKHDHVVFCLEGGKEIRFHDPRKFGKF